MNYPGILSEFRYINGIIELPCLNVSDCHNTKLLLYLSKSTPLMLIKAIKCLSFKTLSI